MPTIIQFFEHIETPVEFGLEPASRDGKIEKHSFNSNGGVGIEEIEPPGPDVDYVIEQHFPGEDKPVTLHVHRAMRHAKIVFDHRRKTIALTAE